MGPIETVDKKLTFAVKFNTLARLAIRILSASVSFLLFRILSAEDYGVVAIALGFVAIVYSFMATGFEAAYLRKGLKPFEKLSSVLYVYFVLTLLVFAVFYVSIDYSGRFFSVPEHMLFPVKVLFLKLLLQGPLMCTRIVAQQNGRLDLLVRGEVMSFLVASLVSVFLAFSGYGVWALVFQNVVMDVVNVLTIAIAVKWIPRPEFKVGFVWSILRSGYLRGIDTMSFTIRERVVKVLIGIAFGVKDLGVYDIVHRLLMQIVSIFLGASVEGVGAIFAKKKSEKQEAITSKAIAAAFDSVTSLLSWLLVPVFVTIALFPTQTFHSYTGKDFVGLESFLVASVVYVTLHSFEFILSRISLFVSPTRVLWYRAIPLLAIGLVCSYLSVDGGLLMVTLVMALVSLVNVCLMFYTLGIARSRSAYSWGLSLVCGIACYLIWLGFGDVLLDSLIDFGFAQWVSIGIVSVVVYLSFCCLRLITGQLILGERSAFLRKLS